MFVTSINIRREGYYTNYGKADPTKPMLAQIEVLGMSGEIKLNLSPDMSAKIVAIIAEEVANAGRATAEAMTAEVLNVKAIATAA